MSTSTHFINLLIQGHGFSGSLVLHLVLVKTGLPHMPSPHVERGRQWTPFISLHFICVTSCICAFFYILVYSCIFLDILAYFCIFLDCSSILSYILVYSYILLMNILYILVYSYIFLVFLYCCCAFLHILVYS